MNTFQIVLKGGRTQNIAADLYTLGRRNARFYASGRVVAKFERDSVIFIDHLEAADFSAGHSHSLVHRPA